MKKFPIILDLETKLTFRQVQDPKKLGISVVAIYDYSQEKSQVFLENQLAKLYPLLESASYLVGFNIKSFDLPVLQGYYPGNIDQFAVFDILDDVKEKIGRRLALNDLIQATLGLKKTGHGLKAIDYYQTGQWEKLKQYCLDDVILTKKLFDFGIKHNQIFYLNEVGKIPIKVDWKKYFEKGDGENDISLTLPF